MFISNFKSRKTKNFLIGAISFFCFIIMCFCGFSLTISNTASQSILKAQSVGNFPYFKAKVGSIDFFNGQTVFLNSGQSLEITFGKPIGMPHEEATNIYLNQDNIGEHALSWLSGGFELKINGERVLNPELSEKYSIEKYYYNPGYVHGSESNPEGREFEYFTLSINLADTTLFPSGKYEITFNDFMEYSGIDYSFGNKKTFTAIFYLFNTLDYFSSESAINAKIEMKNTREVSKLDTIYKNYFYFNYTNQNPANDFNSLPYLSFEKNKFIIEISKSYQGITQSCTVSKFEPNYVRLGTNTNNNFVDVVSKPEEPDKLLIYFKDLGEYAINFKFIYSENESTYTLLTNNKIDNFKKDILHIFGYQLFYSDINDQKNNEFKDIQNGEYNLNNSSDVSYLLPYENLSNKYVANLADDNAIMQELNGETAVSTNQPIVSVKYNTNLEIVNSYYYLWDSETSDWKKQGDEYQKYPYSNTNFADAGKYLLKVIYSYNQNYDSNGNLASDVFFTQYFYFTITNITATVSVREQITNFDTGEITEKSLSTNAYTQNPVRIILSGQSIFNSDVRVIIGSKDYIFTNYNTIETTLNSDAQEQSYIVSANKNYKITMYFGKNKTQTSFFTIDNSPFEDVRVVSVTKSVGSSKHYVKGNEISFFTSQSVSLEWKEKQSGAGSRAYYKYVPFKNIGHTTPSTNYFNTEEALPTNYSLDFNINNEFAEIHYSNTQNKSLIDGSSVFSEQGFYVVYLADEAGNWRYVSFCIDKTEMTIWQYSNNAYQDVQNYNVVSADTKLQWGGYKLINLNLYYNQLESIKDKWIKDVFKGKIEDIEDNDILNSKFDDGKLYFAVEVHSIKYLQEGSAYVQLNGNISYEIKLIQTIDGTELAVEMTYVFYFIDESNPYFKSASTLSTADFANRASKNFRITTSSDASKADIILNESNVGPTDFTNIAYNSSNLSQSGFTDSYSYNSIYETYSDKIDTRSKYYYATGSTASKNISLLTYIFITNPSDSIIVEKVTVYYYAFVTIGKQYKLSDTAEETVIYDINESIDHTENIENGDFLGFQAYNVNVEYDSVSNSYRSKEGKYVIVRSYTQDSTVDKYDFLIRESVFMVDRQDIVSSPTYVDDELLSVIGQFIHIFVLDGELDKRVKFDDIYMAYNNDGFILETNKLPVISYTPISKYGNGTDDLFNIFDVLQYFYTMTSDSENVYLKRFKVGDIDEKSILGISYFGSGTFLTNNFNIPSNLQKIKNSSFDLTVRIDYAVESNYERALIYNGTTAGLNGYFTSPEFKNEGYYFVTMTQNYANGNIFPNVRNTFSFNFCITKLKPQFDFLDSDGEILKNAPSAINTYYTNENSARVSWNDNKSPYMAKINMTADGRGYTTGIYYYTNNNPTRRYIKVDDIVTNGLNHYFDLDISSFNTSTIIYVYMEYEGRIQNDSSHITKTLYIDRQAPTKVLNTLIASTSVGGISVGGYSRLYVDEANEPTETDRRYNIPTSTGALAFYTFAVELTEQNLNSLFRSQPTVSGYFTEGYYYYALEIGSSSSLFVTNIASAKNAYASHTVDIFINQIKAGKIYEIIESDLAGNITIYSIYFVKPNTNQIVLDFEKPATDLDKSTNILYGELNQNQNIFAKSYFKMKEISLYNYEWLVINVNSKTYLTTPYIDENHFYDITNWVDLNTPPNIYSLDNIMSFTSSRNVQTLILVEPCKNFNYIFNISITDEQLTYNALVGQEGIRINGFSYQGGISVNLSSISIYSWKSSIYELIYDYENIFYSTNYITYIHETNYKVFSINQPETAYKYVFADNYGISYVFYHTIGEPEIEDKIVGEVDTVLIPDIDGEGMTTWSVGLGQVNYYYSNVDYSVFIKMEYLTYNATTKTFSWTTFNAGGV
ncbi:MAG: hypothetical protein PHH71_01115, partial [Clostridia bacterium]|nr:hypothetical protein [Clostridia bacterium]